MPEGLGLLVYPVKDLAGATALYSTLLGVQPYMEGAYYVGFKVGDQEVGLDPNGHRKGGSAPLPYFSVADVRKSLHALLEAGAELVQDVQDVGGGQLIASVKDADGNVTGLRQAA
jgi:predicted enzyme related to lactoylglutathione lyase